MKSLKYSFVFFFISLFYLIPSAQTLDTLSLRPGPIDGFDTEVRDNMDWPKWDDDDFIANAWTADGEYFIQRSLIKFDISQIPSDRYIVSAKLSLFCNTISGHHQLHAGENSSFLLTITEPWDQYTVHWTNQPSTTLENSIILPKSISQTQDYLNIDVTDQINNFYNNPSNNHGFMLRLVEEIQYAALVFASSNHVDPTKRPLLEIIYSDCDIPNACFTYSYTDTAGEIQFNAENDPSTTYHWDFGTGDTSNLQDPVYIFPAFGTYYVCLTAMNTCDTLVYCDSVNVCNNVNASFTYNLTNNFGEVQFYSENDPLVSYLWDFGNGDSSNEPNPLYTYSESGIYYVCLTAMNICDTIIYCGYVNTCGAVTAMFNYDLNEHFASFNPDFQIYSATYFWDFGDGFMSDLMNPIHYFNDEGYYNVCLEISSDCGYDYYCEYLQIIVSGTNSLNTEEQFNFFPNPVKDILNISTSSTSPIIKEIQIYSADGTVALRNITLNPNSNNSSYSFDVSFLKSGVYIVSVITEKSIINKKIVVIKG